MDIVLKSRETLLSTDDASAPKPTWWTWRQKIDETHHVKTLHTIRGVGYVMKAEDSHV